MHSLAFRLWHGRHDCIVTDAMIFLQSQSEGSCETSHPVDGCEASPEAAKARGCERSWSLSQLLSHHSGLSQIHRCVFVMKLEAVKGFHRK